MTSLAGHRASKLLRVTAALAFIAVPAAATATLPACNSDGGSFGGTGCTDIGCQDGFILMLSPSDRWPAGAYEFVLETEAGKTTCTGSIPLPPCGQSGLSCVTTPDRGDKNPRIAISGCALDGASQSFPQIDFPDGPAQVNVRISKDGTTLVNQAFTPQYTTSSPNGPQCGPVCRQSSSSMNVF